MDNQILCTETMHMLKHLSKWHSPKSKPTKANQAEVGTNNRSVGGYLKIFVVVNNIRSVKLQKVDSHKGYLGPYVLQVQMPATVVARQSRGGDNCSVRILTVTTGAKKCTFGRNAT